MFLTVIMYYTYMEIIIIKKKEVEQQQFGDAIVGQWKFRYIGSLIYDDNNCIIIISCKFKRDKIVSFEK